MSGVYTEEDLVRALFDRKQRDDKRRLLEERALLTGSNVNDNAQAVKIVYTDDYNQAKTALMWEKL